MRQLMLELNDEEMADLEALARQRRVHPAELLKAAAFERLANHGRPMVLKGRYANWRNLRAIFRGAPGTSTGPGSDVAVTGGEGKSEFLVADKQLRQFPAFLVKSVARARLSNNSGPLVNGEVATIDRVAMEDEAQEERRRARLAILMRSSGIFAGDPGKPKDGLIYQNELRTNGVISDVQPLLSNSLG